MNVIIAETTVDIAKRLGWAAQEPGGIRWLRPNGSDVYILVDVLADRLRDEPLAASHYPEWVSGLTLEHLVTLLEVSWQRTVDGDSIVVLPAKSHEGVTHG